MAYRYGNGRFPDTQHTPIVVLKFVTHLQGGPTKTRRKDGCRVEIKSIVLFRVSFSYSAHKKHFRITGEPTTILLNAETIFRCGTAFKYIYNRATVDSEEHTRQLGEMQ